MNQITLSIFLIGSVMLSSSSGFSERDLSTYVHPIPSEAQNSANAIYKAANGRLSYEGAVYLQNNWRNETTPCPKIPKVGGRLWIVQYQSGFRVGNCFRKCRGSMSAAKYFLGLGSGDCDSMYEDQNGNLQTVCFPEDAAVIVRDHGSVVKIYPARSCP